MMDRGPNDYGPPDRGQNQRASRDRDPYGREPSSDPRANDPRANDPRAQEPYDPYARPYGGDPYGAGEQYPRDPYAPTRDRGPYGPDDDPYGRHRSPRRPDDGDARRYAGPYDDPRADDDGRRGHDDGRRYGARAGEGRRGEPRRTGSPRGDGRRRTGDRESLRLEGDRETLGRDGDRGSLRSRAREVRKNMPLWQELPLLLIVAFCLAVLVRTFLVQAFYIPSGSMEDTLLVGDRVLVNKIVYDVRQPERGEIVVFRGTDNWAPENTSDPNVGFFSKLGRTVGDLVGVSQPGEKDFIKRVIGVPGDEVSCCDVEGKVMVNGTPLDEPYVHEDSPKDAPPVPRECRSRKFGPITVEPGQMWVMGDHRLVSQDSRCQGQVPIDNVIGRAFVIVWPNKRWAGLGVPSTFAHVERPRAAAELPTAPHSDPVVARTGPVGAFGAPIIASLVVPARSRRIRRRPRRTLRP